MSALEWNTALNSVFDVAADMAAAAVEAGDYSPAGPAREFAAQRSMQAMQIEQSVTDEMRWVYRNHGQFDITDLAMEWDR